MERCVNPAAARLLLLGVLAVAAGVGLYDVRAGLIAAGLLLLLGGALSLDVGPRAPRPADSVKQGSRVP